MGRREVVDAQEEPDPSGVLPSDHRTLLVAALVAIAENSLGAMPNGGDLWIEAVAVAGVRVVQFRISDSGPGVPVELHVYPGSFHGSDTMVPWAYHSRRWVTDTRAAIARGLHVET